MIDVTSKKCLHEKCNKHPSFNLPNEKTPIYCKEHCKIDIKYLEIIKLKKLI
jgi:hypothetical protein